MITALFTPLIAYLVNVLNLKQKFNNKLNKTSYNYRWKQVKQESNTIGELLGELSTHAATFKADGLRELDDQKWTKAFKVGLISDIPTLSIARYYYFVPIYNKIVNDIKTMAGQEGLEKMKEFVSIFSEVKDAFLEAEEGVYLALTFDLGMLQQTYLD